MKTINTPAHIEEHRKLMYQFKVSYNFKHGTNLPLFDNKLHGYDCNFKMWITINKGITDLDLHLENIKKNKSRNKVYTEKSKGRYTLVNR